MDRARWRVIGTIAVTATMACLASPGVLAATTPDSAASWHLAYQVPTSHEIQGIAAPARDDGWAFGSIYSKSNALAGSFYLHWAGRSWRKASIPVAAGFVATLIEASSPRNVWIFGYHKDPSDSGAALVYNGQRWKVVDGPWMASLGNGVVANASDVWIMLQPGCTSVGCATTVDHWNGSAWRSYAVPGDLVLVAGGSRPWLVGLAARSAPHDPDRSATYHWNGTGWQSVRGPVGTARDAVGVASPDGRLWLVVRRRTAGPWLLYERRRSTWSSMGALRQFPALDAEIPGLVYDGGNGFWALPFHWTGSHWVNTAPGLNLHPPRPRWLNGFWYNYMAPVAGTSAAWAIVIANSQPYTSGTTQSGIAWYG